MPPPIEAVGLQAIGDKAYFGIWPVSIGGQDIKVAIPPVQRMCAVTVVAGGDGRTPLKDQVPYVEVVVGEIQVGLGNLVADDKYPDVPTEMAVIAVIVRHVPGANFADGYGLAGHCQLR